MAIRNTSIPHFMVMFPLKRWWERAAESSRWSHVSKGGWRCKPAISKAFPRFSAATMAKQGWEGPAGSSKAISTWQNLDLHSSF